MSSRPVLCWFSQVESDGMVTCSKVTSSDGDVQ